jgi:hypothetical protein
MMRKVLSAAAVLAVATMPAFAQTTPPRPATPPPAMATPATPAPPVTAPVVTEAPKAVPGAPVAGANSFTEAQARSRIEANGFTNVTGLTKDDKSVWRGKAMKEGKSVSVALDYQGNIVAN